jgi:membrane protease YdiL (CAAX protease family)
MSKTSQGFKNTVKFLADTAWVVVVVLLLVPKVFSYFDVSSWLQSPLGTTVFMAAMYGVSALVVLLPFFIRGLTWKEILGRLGLWKRPELRMVPWVLFLYGLYIVVSLALVAVVMSLNLPGVDLAQPQENGFEGVRQWHELVAAFVALVVLAPVFEEIIFRGYLFGQLRRRAGFVVSALVTSLVFAVVHLQLNVGLDVFALSLMMCVARERFDSIYPTILMHMFKNLLAYMLLFILPLYGVNLV